MEDQNAPQIPEVNSNMEPSPTTPTNKSGLGKTLMMVVLVAVLIIGPSIGVFYYTKNKVEKDAAATIAPLEAKIAELEASQKKNELTSNASTNSQKYLTITDWKLKMPVDNAYSDLTYKIEKSSDGTFDFAHIIASELIPIYTCAGTKGEIGTVTRYKTQPKDDSGVVRTDAVKVGDYYYVWGSIQNVCSSNANLENSYVSQLATAIKASMISE